MKCDICGWQPTMNRIEDILCEWNFHRYVRHADEIIRDDPVIQESKSSKQVRYWDKKLDKWVTVTPMDNFSYDLQPTGKARKVSKSEEMIYGNAGLIKKDGIDE